MDWLDRKIMKFRDRAAEYQRDGLEVAARVYSRIADELEEDKRRYGDEELSVAAAARESGYDEVSIRRMQKSGRIPPAPNGGIYRKDLPRKPGHGVAPRGPRVVPIGDAETAAVNALAASVLGGRSRVANG